MHVWGPGKAGNYPPPLCHLSTCVLLIQNQPHKESLPLLRSELNQYHLSQDQAGWSCGRYQQAGDRKRLRE